MSVPLSKLSHILSGTSKWLKFSGGREGNNEGGEGEERMDPEGKEGGRKRVAALLPFCKRAACMPKEEEKGTQECGRRGLAELEVGTQKYSLERQGISKE